MTHPHDLVWIDNITSLAFNGELPDWVVHHWHISLPLVMRRATTKKGFIPVGIRGKERSQRFACEVSIASITRIITPEDLVNSLSLTQKQLCSALTTLQLLKNHNISWNWGVTGSCGYQLATGITTLTAQSDLDILIRCPTSVLFDEFIKLTNFFKTLPTRIDAQIETPYGGFALNEWVRDKKVLLKTVTGPVITNNPWQL